MKIVEYEQLPGSDTSKTFDGHAHGANVSFFLTHTPPGRGPGLHTHPYEETFIVEAGTVEFRVGEDTVEVGAGHVVVVPAGTPHGFVNAGSTPLRTINIHPAARMQTEWLE